VVARLLLLLPMAASAAWMPIGPYGGNIQTVGMDPHDPDRLYAVTYRYPAEPLLFRSTDAGTSWIAAGKFTYPDVSGLTVDPHQRTTLLACSRGSVLWRSTDAGQTWETVSLPGHAGELEPDPFTNGRIFAAGYVEAAHPQPAFLATTDHGRTWSALVLDTCAGNGLTCCVDPGTPGTLYVGCDSGRLYRSTDSGLTWAACDSGLPAGEPVMSVAVCPASRAVLVCGTTGAVCRSSDAGASWRVVSSVQKVADVTFSSDDPAIVWALCRDSVERVVVSTDTGLTWQGPPSDSVFYRAARLSLDPRDARVAIVNSWRGVLRTTDLGASWRYVNHGLDFSDVYTVGVNPANGREFYVSAHDTRLFRTTDCGDSWTQTRGFWCMQNGMCCALAVAPEPTGALVYGFEGGG
jgi:photosystem II stability/assembly factor-like uncharacterized protein